MPEETIFQKPTGPSANSNPPAGPLRSEASEAGPPALPGSSQVSPQPSSPIDHGEGFFSRFSKIFKIGALLFIILTIIFSLLTFVFPKSNKTETQEATLTYWGLREDESVMKSIISDFEKENPKIKINYIKQDLEDYREKLSVRVPNGNGPDVFRFHNTWYPMLSGILLPLPKETIERREFENSFYDVSRKDLIKNGAIYGIPLGIDTLALYINPKIFDLASQEQGGTIVVPTTWQQFIESSQALTKRNIEGKIDMAGAGVGTFENVNYAPDIISLLFAQNGVYFENLDRSRPKIIDALRFYTNFALLEDNVWDQTLDSSLEVFAQGKLAMYFGYSWDYFTIKNLNPDIDFKIVPVPQLVSDKNFNIASYFAEGVSLKSKHQKEALQFMKFLARAKTQEKFYQGPFSNNNLADQAKTAISSPFADGTFDNGLNDKLNNYLKDSINAILSGTPEESAADTLIQGYQKVMAEYELEAPKTEN